LKCKDGCSGTGVFTLNFKREEDKRGTNDEIKKIVIFSNTIFLNVID
jgi:hypothetical protein